MSDGEMQPVPTPRLKVRYQKEIVPAMVTDYKVLQSLPLRNWVFSFKIGEIWFRVQLMLSRLFIELHCGSLQE